MSLPLVVSPADVAAADPTTIRLVDLRSREAWIEAHPTGAMHLEAALLNRSEPPAGGLLPDARTMAALVASLGLDDVAAGNRPRHVVACDAGGATEAARLVWALQAYGVTSCSWLNGGARAWLAAKLPLEHGETAAPSPTPFAIGPGEANILDADTLLGELDDADLAIVDVRTAAEFAGTDVRAAMGGHVPGAVHLEWTRLLDADGRLLDDDTLRARLAEAGVALDGRVVVYCQTHQRSAVTWVALKHLGVADVRALDGAWSTWGNRPDLPKHV